MLLGVVGLPGGAEWLVIAAVVLVLFVPSLLFFGLGYAMGRRSAGPAAGATQSEAPSARVPRSADETAPDHGTGPGGADDV